MLSGTCRVSQHRKCARAKVYEDGQKCTCGCHDGSHVIRIVKCPFTCFVCKRGFQSERNLEQHLLFIHQTYMQPCSTGLAEKQGLIDNNLRRAWRREYDKMQDVKYRLVAKFRDEILEGRKVIVDIGDIEFYNNTHEKSFGERLLKSYYQRRRIVNQLESAAKQRRVLLYV